VAPNTKAQPTANPASNLITQSLLDAPFAPPRLERIRSKKPAAKSDAIPAVLGRDRGTIASNPGSTDAMGATSARSRERGGGPFRPVKRVAVTTLKDWRPSLFQGFARAGGWPKRGRNSGASYRKKTRQ
jgi:hypothetical protein